MTLDKPPMQWYEDRSSRRLGLLAVVGIAVCCGLPALIGAGALAVIGAALRSAWVVAAAALVAAGTLAYFASRHRAKGPAGCAALAARPTCCPDSDVAGDDQRLPRGEIPSTHVHR